MAFMEPEAYKGKGYEVETTGGTFYVPLDVLEEGSPEKRADMDLYLMQYAPEMVHGRLVRVTRVTGYFARLSAPGYLDATDWEFFAKKKELDEWLAEQEEGEEDDDDYEENPRRRVRRNPEGGWYAIIADSDYRGGRIMVAITQSPSETVKRTQREYGAWTGKGDVQSIGPFRSAAAASAAGKEYEKVPRR